MHPVNSEDTDNPTLDGQEISDVGDTFRLDDTIGCPDSTPETSDNGDNTVIQDPNTVIQDPNTVIQNPTDPDPISHMSVEQWLESLRRTDRTFYNMMAMEVWSIAKSMDTLIPGFWSKFMKNRQLAVQNFVVKRRNDKATGLRLEDLGNPDGTTIKRDDAQQDVD